MSWIEQELGDIECPHCGYEAFETAEFNTFEGDRHGITGSLREVECQHCDEVFFFKARIKFEIDVDVYKKKPK